MTLWRDVKGYEGIYKISNTGMILSLNRPYNHRGDHYMVDHGDAHGYRIVMLCKGGVCKTHRVHRLVAEAFVQNPHGYTEINHIDENKANNNADNLEWCTRAYNIHYGSRTQKTATKVAMFSVNMDLIKTYPSIREACRQNGFNCPGNISNVLKGKATTAYGYRWKEVS